MPGLALNPDIGLLPVYFFLPVFALLLIFSGLHFRLLPIVSGFFRFGEGTGKFVWTGIYRIGG